MGMLNERGFVNNMLRRRALGQNVLPTRVLSVANLVSRSYSTRPLQPLYTNQDLSNHTHFRTAYSRVQCSNQNRYPVLPPRISISIHSPTPSQLAILTRPLPPRTFIPNMTLTTSILRIPTSTYQSTASASHSLHSFPTFQFL